MVSNRNDIRGSLSAFEALGGVPRDALRSPQTITFIRASADVVRIGGG
jgi:hypothetical protein